MNRSMLIDQVAEKTGFYKKSVDSIVKACEETILEALQNNEQVHLHGFITFSIRDIAEKDYINPKTKERVILPPTKKVKVKVSEKLNKQL